jgi:regulator of RNase E activity RraA
MSYQALWSDWIAKNPTNNMMIRKVQREAFLAGAAATMELIHEHNDASERLASDYVSENQMGLVLVDGGKD